MTTQEMKEVLRKVFTNTDEDYLKIDIKHFWKTFEHINELLDAELEGRLVITPCEGIPKITKCQK